jgi:hypothetical protein
MYLRWALREERANARQPGPAAMSYHSRRVPITRRGPKIAEASDPVDARKCAVREMFAKAEFHRQTATQIRTLQVQDARQPVAHENVKPITRGIAVPAHKLAEMPVARVTMLRLRGQPCDVAGGKFDIKKARNFGADGIGNNPRHQLRFAFQAGPQQKTMRAGLAASWAALQIGWRFTRTWRRSGNIPSEFPGRHCVGPLRGLLGLSKVGFHVTDC